MFKLQVFENKHAYTLELRNDNISSFCWKVTTKDDCCDSSICTQLNEDTDACNEELPDDYLVLGKWKSELTNRMYLVIISLRENNRIALLSTSIKSKEIKSISNKFAYRKKSNKILSARTINNNNITGQFYYIEPFEIWYNGSCSTYESYINMNGLRLNNMHDSIRTTDKLKKNRKNVCEISDLDKGAITYDDTIKRRKIKSKAAIKENDSNILMKIFNGFGKTIDMKKINPSLIKNATGIDISKLKNERRANEATTDDYDKNVIDNLSVSELLEELDVGRTVVLNPDLLTNDPIKMAKIISKMQSYDWKISQNSKKDIIKKENIECSTIGVDIDSVIIWCCGISSSVQNSIKNQRSQLLQDMLQKILSFDNGYAHKFKENNITNCNKSIQVSAMAIQVVSYFEFFITERERNTRVVMDTSTFYESKKIPTIGNYKTDIEKSKLISLSSMSMNSVEPVYSWIFAPNMDVAKLGLCMKEIAIGLLLLIQPSSYELDVMSILDNHKTDSNNIQINGGVWLYRLTWVYFLLKTKTECTYIEETYASKKHGVNQFTSDWKEFMNKNDNNTHKMHANIISRNLLQRTNDTHVASMFQMFESNMFESKIAIGIGMQISGFDTTNQNNVYISMEIDENDDNKIDLYTYGGLPKSMGGHTTTYPAAKCAPFFKDSKSKKIDKNQNDCRPEISLGRSQYYNNQFRNAAGESKNVEASESLRLEAAEIEHENPTTTKVSINVLLDNLQKMTMYAVSNASNFRNVGGFRLENSYIYQKKNAEYSIRCYGKNYSNNENISNMLCELIMQTREHIIQKCHVYDLNLISNYCILNQGVYIQLYRCGLKALNITENCYEKAAVLLFVEQITNYLTSYYHGKKLRLFETSRDIYYGRNIIMATPTKIVRSFMSQFDEKMILNKSASINSIVEKEKVRELLEEPSPFLLTKNICRNIAKIGNDKSLKEKLHLGIWQGVKRKTILKCCHCNTLFVSKAYLSTHLDSRVDCRTIMSKISDGNVEVTGDIVRKYIEQVLNSVEKNSKSYFAIHTFIQGKSLYIQGDAGTGKSYLANKLMELAELLYMPSEQFVLAPTGLACYNSGPLCTTYHKALNIKGTDLKPINIEDNLLSKTLADKTTESKFKSAKILFADEVGATPAHYMITFEKGLRMAKKSDVAFGGIQLVIVGQAVQCSPIYTGVPLNLRYSAGRSCDLENLCVPIHLNKIMRSTGDKVYIALSGLIRDAEVEKKDLDEIKKGGKSIKALQDKSYKAFKTNDSNNEPRNNNAFKQYLKEVLYVCHEWKDILARYKMVYASILHPKCDVSFLAIKIMVMVKFENIWSVKYLKEDPTDVKNNKCLNVLLLYIGCSVVIQRNDGNQKKGARAYFTGVTDTNTEEIITDATKIKELESSLNDIKSKNPGRYKFNFDLEMKLAGRLFYEPIKLSRIDILNKYDSNKDKKKMYQLQVLPGFAMTGTHIDQYKYTHAYIYINIYISHHPKFVTNLSFINFSTTITRYDFR